ncbi:hypothetical protein ES708_13547 [subsurface metagenome]
MPKIAFLGAGSFVFTRNLIRDILTYPALAGSDLYLMDIDAERLSYIRRAVDHTVETGAYPARVVATRDREQALEGADGVVCTILQGGVGVWRHDIEIPKKYGLDINVGDTRGPAGIFRALRTIPVMLSICRDMERLCPKATLLNYTNPMAMLCQAMQSHSGVRVTGLCHSVQGTAEMLGRWICAGAEQISYLCAGINHQAWFLEFLCDGENAYPRIREALKRPEVLNEEPVRNEMYLRLDYYVTESSGHNSEYNPWFRKRPELIERYCRHGTGWNPGEHAFLVREHLAREKSWRQDIETKLAAAGRPEAGQGVRRRHLQCPVRGRGAVPLQRQPAQLRPDRQPARRIVRGGAGAGLPLRAAGDTGRRSASAPGCPERPQRGLRGPGRGGCCRRRPAQDLSRRGPGSSHLRRVKPGGDPVHGR